jgi:ubiquinone/menaquinone biosynthesis C-methylase UbiE
MEEKLALLHSKAMDLHRAAAVGFDRAADAYEQGRPGYPVPAVQWLTRALGLGAGSVVVDLAAGTGKLTRELVLTGAQVIAVEPVAGMRAVLAESCPRAEALAGTAEAIPVATASADAITVAQAFHWFDGERALPEIHRVLLPTGKLGLIYNLPDVRHPLQGALEKLYDRHRGSTPSHRSSQWRDAFTATGLFRLADTRRFRNVQRLDADGLVNRVASMSFVAALADLERERLSDEVRALAREQGGEMDLEYEVEVSIYAAQSAAGST